MRLIDADALYKDICDSLNEMTRIGIAVDGEWLWGKLNDSLENAPTIEPERVWHPVEKPPAHHKDVIVRGVEAIGNVTVHKVMQWDVDTWRPTNYAPSITWTEWSEI